MAKKVDKKGPSAKKNGTKWTRTTVLIREDHLEKFKVLAWWDRKTIKDLFDQMIDDYLATKNHIDDLIKERKKSFAEKD